MLNAIRSQYNFQNSQIGNSRTKEAFGSHSLYSRNHQIKDTICFGNKDAEIAKAKEEGCYDPHRAVVTALPLKRANDASGIPTENVIKAMEKYKIPNEYKTTLKEILDGASSFSSKPKTSDSILEEVAIAINNSDNKTTLDKMNEEIKNNIKPYMLKGAYRVFDGNLNGKDKVSFPDWQKSAALSQMIGESKTAKETPDPWVVILDHLMNDPNTHKNDLFVRRQAAEALCSIGNSPKHLEVFARCKETNNDAFLNGIATAGENMIKVRIDEKA